ncbi:MAG TPA: hypothetical protein VNO70_08985 [Blastocatellia bacterium]|nr:hypothetical protein [Blastocatellia bacterium]
MTPEQIKAKLDFLASSVLATKAELDLLIPYIASESDKKIAESILIDLFWAAENLTVIGLRQIGKALDDNMGITNL